MGPDAVGKFLFILRKNLSSVPWDKCVRWFSDLPNFVKAYQTSKTPSSCLGAGQIFVRREIWQICQFKPRDSKENVNQENLISIFSRSTAKIKSIYLRGNQTINMEDSYLGMLHDDPFAQYNYYGSQVYGPSSAQFVHPYVHLSQPSTSTSTSFTTTCYQIESSQADWHLTN